MLNPSEHVDRCGLCVHRRGPTPELLTANALCVVRGFHWETKDQVKDPPGLKRVFGVEQVPEVYPVRVE